MDAFKRAFKANPADASSMGRPGGSATGIAGQRDDLNPEAQKELAQLRNTLQNNMQQQRAQHHAFEALSLPGSQPASRVSD